MTAAEGIGLIYLAMGAAWACWVTMILLDIKKRISWGNQVASEVVTLSRLVQQQVKIIETKSKIQ